MHACHIFLHVTVPSAQLQGCAVYHMVS